MRPGRHLCSIPGSFREQFQVAVPFLKEGVRERQKCLYVANDNTPDVVRAQLAPHGLAAAVKIVASEETPLRAEYIDTTRLLGAWASATDAATAEGYAGLRVVVEMTWALAADMHALAAYELEAEHLFAAKPLFALCQYNRNRFPAATVRHAAIHSHPELLREDGTVARGLPEDAVRALGL
jgi:hypothetical protein